MASADRFVADTVAVLAMLSASDRKMGREALRAFDGAAAGRHGIVISVVSLWEMAILEENNRLRFPCGFAPLRENLMASPGFRIEPLTADDVDEARARPRLVDPMDRFIAGTAARMRLPLITPDERIRRHGRVPTVW